jgi:hypothetical protein
MKAQVLGSSLTWCVTVVWGSSPCIHLLALGWFPAYTCYVLLSVVNPFLNCLKLIQTCLIVIFCFTWSVWAYASTCTYCYTHMTAPTRASFQSDCYNSWSFCISASFAFMTCCKGELQSLVLAWCVHVLTRGRDSTRLKGERHKTEEISNLPHGECMHSSGRLHLFRGNCIWVASARCVEPLPLMEDLDIFLAFRALLVVMSPLPLLEGQLCFTWLRWVVAHVFGTKFYLFQMTLFWLFFDFWSFGWALCFLFFFFFFCSSCLCVGDLVLTMHSLRGRLRTQGWYVPLWFILWWVIVNRIHDLD